MAIRRPDITLTPEPQVCAECGQAYESASETARYCTFACRQRARDRRKYHARRGRVNGEVESFNLREIAERDDWTCHVCAGPVTSEDWSIDHLVPISQGGQHIRSNVALAHLRCNALREYETQAPPIPDAEGAAVCAAVSG
jgi:5-methylcytosine-specific restriction endonuclease McrA